MLIPELTNGKMENVSCANKTRKILLFIMYILFLKITTFFWIILTFQASHTRLFFETITTNLWGRRVKGRHMGSKTEEKNTPGRSYF